MVGIPASGKSTFVSQNSSVKTFCISRDQIRRYYNDKLSEVEVTAKFEQMIELAMLRPGIETLFIDNTNLKQHYILSIMNKCKEFCNDCKFFIKIFDTDYNICLKRNAKRNGVERVPDHVMYNMKLNFDKFINDVDKFCIKNNINIIK